jgi:hypothetical protein
LVRRLSWIASKEQKYQVPFEYQRFQQMPQKYVLLGPEGNSSRIETGRGFLIAEGEK